MFEQAKRPQLKAPEPRRPASAPLKSATEPAAPMPNVFTRPLERPPQKKQRKPCPACEEEGTTCAGCQKKAAPALERPPASTQMRRGTPGEDPAERQADELGKDIGEELKGTESVGHGPMPKSVQDVAETHLGVSLAGTYIDAGSSGQKKARSESALAVTEGKRIAFGEGMLSTANPEGRNLLGHELVHVAQQERASEFHTAQLKSGVDNGAKKDTQKSGVALIEAILEGRPVGRPPTTGFKNTFPLYTAWKGLGPDLGTAVEKHGGLWKKTKKQYPLTVQMLLVDVQAKFASDVLALALSHVAKNEAYIKGEMVALGLSPEQELNREGQPEAPPAVEAAVAPPSKSVVERLSETQRLAKVAKLAQAELTRMRGMTVGLNGEKFDPENPPSEQLDFGGVTSWQMAKRRYDDVSALLAVIASTNPILFQAVGTGKGSDLESLAKTNPRKSPVVARRAARTQLVLMLKNAKAARAGLQAGNVGFEDLVADQEQLLGGSASASHTRWNKPFYKDEAVGAVAHAREADAWMKLGLTAAKYIALVVATLGTIGGAAFVIGSAAFIGVRAAEDERARHKAMTMQALGRSAARSDLIDVYRGQITAAEAEAEAKALGLRTLSALALPFAQGLILDAGIAELATFLRRTRVLQRMYSAEIAGTSLEKALVKAYLKGRRLLKLVKSGGAAGKAAEREIPAMLKAANEAEQRVFAASAKAEEETGVTSVRKAEMEYAADRQATTAREPFKLVVLEGEDVRELERLQREVPKWIAQLQRAKDVDLIKDADFVRYRARIEALGMKMEQAALHGTEVDQKIAAQQGVLFEDFTKQIGKMIGQKTGGKISNVGFKLRAGLELMTRDPKTQEEFLQQVIVSQGEWQPHHLVPRSLAGKGQHGSLLVRIAVKRGIYDIDRTSNAMPLAGFKMTSEEAERLGKLGDVPKLTGHVGGHREYLTSLVERAQTGAQRVLVQAEQQGVFSQTELDAFGRGSLSMEQALDIVATRKPELIENQMAALENAGRTLVRNEEEEILQ